MRHLTTPHLTGIQQRLLDTLFEEGGLNTKLIERYVLPTLSRRQVGKELAQLRAQHLVASQPLGAAEGSEYCWFITYAGARALNRAVVHTDARYRAPTTIQLAHKALTLRLGATLLNLNWQYIPPYPYNSSHPKPDDTPQRQALYRAVDTHFQRTPPGTTAPRLHPSQVPKGVNDWVAWPTDHPDKAIVLIVHPIGGTQHFWRAGNLKQRGRPAQEHTPARTRLYADLAQILPVIGIFANPALAADYQPLLESAHIRGLTLDELPAFLQNQRLR